MSRRARVLAGLVLVGLLLTAGCFSIRVRTDWDPTSDFASFQRYHWLEPPRRENASPFADNDLLRRSLRLAIEGALDARGFKPVETPEAADFLVSWDVTLEERLRADGVTAGGFYGDRRFWGAGLGTSTIRTFQDSTLIIDFVDAKTHLLVWRGWANGVVRTRDRNRSQERVNDGVRRILAAFPPKESDSGS